MFSPFQFKSITSHFEHTQYKNLTTLQNKLEATKYELKDVFFMAC